MHSFKKTAPVWACAALAAIGAAVALSSQVSSNPAPALTPAAPSAASVVPPAAPATTSAAPASPSARTADQRPEPAAPTLRTVTAAEAVAAVRPPAAVAASIAFKPRPERVVRSQIKFETVRWAGKKVKTLDESSRLLLVKSAAHRAGLHEVGLGFEDVYGVIKAETSWIPRTGMGKNGVPSLGLAQFEPRTAKGLGLKNPNDPVQAVYYAAVNMKHGAEWAARKIDHLDLTPEQRAAKVREGVSIYYNLSVKGRNRWNGFNTARLPVETRRHIRNVRAGANEAAKLAQKYGSI